MIGHGKKLWGIYVILNEEKVEEDTSSSDAKKVMDV